MVNTLIDGKPPGERVEPESEQSSNFQERLRQFFVPTTTRKYIELKEKYESQYESKLKSMQKNVETLRKLYKDALEERQKLLDEIEEHHPKVDTSALIKKYLEHVDITRKLRIHLEEMEEDRKSFKEHVETGATLEFTKQFKGLRDWAQKISPVVDYISTALVILSTAGAGLVYSTIFSASRGNIGLMCFTFPLFTVGFLVPAIIQVILKWAARLSHEIVFASQKFWKVVIIIFMSFASAAVMIAITILNATIFFLEPESSSPQGADAGQDPGGELDMTNVLQVPGIIAFALSGVIFMLLAVAFVLCAFARGPKRFMNSLIHGHLGMRPHKSLGEYIHA
ncbi:hypothetical protein BDQ17DRAFT_1372789 [Cyathus striatus]|nr:hypothetical protein BDQ17DRAFT_1372789 [Cyathus striatus]